MFMRNLFGCVIVLAMLSGSLPIAAQELSAIGNYRGINVYFHARQGEDDYRLLASWGVKVVRLFISADSNSVDYDGIYDEGGELATNKLDDVDQAIKLAKKYSIKVILATSTFPGDDDKIWSDYSYWEGLIKLWSEIAKRYKDNDTVIGYHPIDEPSLVRINGSILDQALMRAGKWSFPNSWRGTPKDYFALIKRLGLAIGDIDHGKFIVVSGVGLWGHAVNYNWMEPIPGINAVYSFNPYIPGAFADSGKKDKKTGLARELATYSSARDKERLYLALQPVADFAKKNKAEIFVSGFGIPYTTEKMGAKDWMDDMLGYFNNHGWGWAYFSYGIPFRSPEVLGPGNAKGEWRKDENTERLTVLQKHWRTSTGSGVTNK